MIKLNHVSFSYQNGEANEMQVLSDVSFQASRGECVVLCGKSGCGKTTMLRLVNGLIPHFYAGKLEGNVLVGGQESSLIRRVICVIKEILGRNDRSAHRQPLHV